MIKQIPNNEIDRRYKGFTLFKNFKSVDLYFRMTGNVPGVLEKYNSSLADYIDQYINKNLPKGIFTFKIIEENKLFRVTYVKNAITEKEVINFTNSLGL
ncbi:MAG: hypothetical protein M1324_01965 [Patescibacteria group bacterium]|nr:hypothetical protein [Patescibacteria group bacterium]